MHLIVFNTPPVEAAVTSTQHSTCLHRNAQERELAQLPHPCLDLFILLNKWVIPEEESADKSRDDFVLVLITSWSPFLQILGGRCRDFDPVFSPSSRPPGLFSSALTRTLAFRTSPAEVCGLELRPQHPKSLWGSATPRINSFRVSSSPFPSFDTTILLAIVRAAELVDYTSRRNKNQSCSRESTVHLQGNAHFYTPGDTTRITPKTVDFHHNKRNKTHMRSTAVDARILVIAWHTFTVGGRKRFGMINFDKLYLAMDTAVLEQCPKAHRVTVKYTYL